MIYVVKPHEETTDGGDLAYTQVTMYLASMYCSHAATTDCSFPNTIVALAMVVFLVQELHMSSRSSKDLPGLRGRREKVKKILSLLFKVNPLYY